MDRCWEMTQLCPTQEVPTLFRNSSEQRKQNKRDVYVMHEQHNWDLILLSYGWAQHCRWNLTTEDFMKGFCECFITRQLEASHDTPSSLINNSVYAFLIPPMNTQQSVLSHLTVIPLFTLSDSIRWVDRHSFRLISEMSPVWAWLEVRQIHWVYRINQCFLLPSS